MEPSSTAFCRAGALLTLIALISSDMSEPAAARGVAAMGRVQAIRVVPRIPVQPRTLHGNIAPQQVFRRQKQAVLGKRFGTIISAEQGRLFLPYDPYLVDMGDSRTRRNFPTATISDRPSCLFEQPACVRPLIIQIKPARHATHFPRVIYGRPLFC